MSSEYSRTTDFVCLCGGKFKSFDLRADFNFYHPTEIAIGGKNEFVFPVPKDADGKGFDERRRHRCLRSVDGNLATPRILFQICVTLMFLPAKNRFFTFAEDRQRYGMG